MIQRRGKMVGNPLFVMNSEGYSLAINGSLPEEINTALSETGIVVLENTETEQMMFLVKDPSKEGDLIKEEFEPTEEDNDGDAGDEDDKYFAHRRRAVTAALKINKSLS